MPTLKKRLANALMGEEMKRLEALSAAFVLAYEKRPYLLDDLTELESGYYDRTLRHVRDIKLLQYVEADENERQKAVRESRILYSTDPLTHRMVGLWTDFGYGQTIEIAPTDEQAKEVWEEFWNSRSNSWVLARRKLHQLSDLLLVDGEVFFVFFVSRVDGVTTMRKIPADQIEEIITDPDDAAVELYYKRVWCKENETTDTILYYPNWFATDKELATVKSKIGKEEGEIAGNGSTYICAMHVAHNTLGQRGWPMVYTAMPWIQAYKNFMQDRAALARAVASMVRDITTEGGSRAVEFLKNTFQSSHMLSSSTQAYDTNPPPIAGSDFVHNQAMKVRAMPLTTAAGDAQIDGATLLGMVGIGMGVYPHWLGRGEAFRLATASSMEPPIMRQFDRYQEFWADVWREVVDLVLTMKERYSDETFETHNAEVSLDPLIELDLAEGSRALWELFRQGLIPVEAGERKALELLGFKNIDEIMAREPLPEPEPKPEGGAG